MPSGHDESPINPLPPVVVALALVIIGIELAFQAGARGLAGGPGGVGWRIEAIRRFAFSAEIFDWMAANRLWPAEHMLRFVTYPFVHAGFTHALMVVVFLLALGKMVGELFGTLAVLLVFFVSSAAGALAYGLLLQTPVPLVGGFPAAYGLIGSYSFMLWMALAGTDRNRMQAFSLIGLLMGFQLVFGLLFGGRPDWVADLAGFAAGFLLSFLLVPGALERILARLRNR